MNELDSKLAVIIPAFNAETTLAATVRSVLAQKGVAEIVIVDDGSGDGTLEIAQGFEPHVRVLTGPNAGVSVARNRGAAESSAAWLLFLDADDLLEEGTLKARLEIGAELNADVIVCDWRDLQEGEDEGNQLGPVRSIDWAKMSEDAEIATAVSVWATTAAILYKRCFFEKIGGFRADLPVIQDARFLFDAAFHGARIVHAPHVGARYRIMNGSLSRRDPGRFWSDVFKNGKQIDALWRSRGALSRNQASALASIYENASLGLLECRHKGFFEAAKSRRSLDIPPCRTFRAAYPLSRVFGLHVTHSILSGLKVLATASHLPSLR